MGFILLSADVMAYVKFATVKSLKHVVFVGTLLASALVLYYVLITENMIRVPSNTINHALLTNFPSYHVRNVTGSSTINTHRPNNALQKVILYWSKGGWYKGTDAGHHGICGHCPIVRDRNLLTHEDTAAVIFPFETDTFDDYPRNNSRRSRQLYVWWSVESPSMTKYVHGWKKLDLREIGDYYMNGTITCRSDSLINGFLWNPIRDVQSQTSKSERNVTRLLATKRKTAVWFVSNCRVGSNNANRLRISDDLIKHGLKVDRFGRCFNNSKAAPKRNSNEFFRLIERYRFYLSFENSLHCRGYITEKFYTNGLLAGAVPIVSGATRADYDAVAPPHSYIHVEDFNSTKELVDYLHYLENNETAYAEYFAWRKLDQKDFYPYGRYGGLCGLCRFLYGIAPNDTRKFGEIYGWYGERYESSVGFPFEAKLKSLHDWWYGTASKDCLQGDKA